MAAVSLYLSTRWIWCRNISVQVSAAPKLNKLGGQDWAKAKAKARKAVQIMAEDLVALYAKRAAAQGFVYGADTIWQQEFEESFPMRKRMTS